MSAPFQGPIPYRVVYSEAARATLRDLAARADRSGQRAEFVAAVREIDRLLHIYPQFGDPIVDLEAEPGQVRVATVPPLVVRYAIYDERRLVVVAAPPLLLPNSGL